MTNSQYIARTFVRKWSILSEVVFGEVVLGGLANALNDHGVIDDGEENSMGGTPSPADGQFPQIQAQFLGLIGLRIAVGIDRELRPKAKHLSLPLSHGAGIPFPHEV